ncbi:MAG: class I SAM-dependent methyltransferase [Anaerolineae bacterium]
MRDDAPSPRYRIKPSASVTESGIGHPLAESCPCPDALAAAQHSPVRLQRRHRQTAFHGAGSRGESATAGAFDTVTIVRTLHHAADVPRVLRGTAEILAPGGTLVLEFANKRNLKAMMRYAVGRQAWSPWDRKPVEFVELNFDFHPAWVEEELRKVGLVVKERRAVSTLRLGVLKRAVPTRVLVGLDRACQRVGGVVPVSPSVFVRCEAEG